MNRIEQGGPRFLNEVGLTQDPYHLEFSRGQFAVRLCPRQLIGGQRRVADRPA